MKVHVVSVILNLNQLCYNFISVLDHPRTQRNHHVLIVYRTSQSIDTGNTGNNDHIFAFAQRRGGRKTKFINFIIYRGILGNIRV